MTLVLLRHGQSTWNADNLFTGWYDSDLSEQGRAEAVRAGELLAQESLLPDVVHTSLLVRAIRTADLTLDVLDRLWLPVRRSWRLNERHYGALQGLNKKQTVAEHGAEMVQRWRRSYDEPPPPVDRTSPHHPANDPRYAGLPPHVLPGSECLKDVLDRMLPWWEDQCVPDLRAGRVVLVAAHGNSLRALVKHIDGIGDREIVGLNIPTGVPLVYELDGDLTPVAPADTRDGALRGRYLDPEAAMVGAAAVAAQTGG